MPDDKAQEKGLKHQPPVVSPKAWEAARQKLLVKEKAHTHARDALAAERRRMPWLKVEKAYEFEGPEGKASLLELFDGRRQLIVYRAFFEPGVEGWPDHACVGCSLVADHVAPPAHLNARDTSLAFVSRAPQAEIARLKARMGWQHIAWFTVTDDFDADFGVGEWHGTNAFIRDGERVFRTYFINERGDEQMGGLWNYLDITALGRQEKWEDSPEGYPQTAPYDWWKWHDSYGAEKKAARKRVDASVKQHETKGHDMAKNKIAKNTICVWYDKDAEAAARFYAATFPDSAVGAIHRAPSDNPSTKAGDVLVVEFTVAGIPCIGLNGGPAFKHNEAFSFQIATDDQAETDRYWNAIVGNGGQESDCGWCKDKWGVSWQITPRVLTEAMAAGGAQAKRAFDAMMNMKKIDVAAIEAARRGGGAKAA